MTILGPVAFLIGLVAIGVLAYGALSPEERLKVLQRVVNIVRRLAEYGRGEIQPFEEALRARRTRALVTIAIAAVNAVVFLAMLFGRGSRSDVATLIGWGATFGPRTTNGQWWRLVTAIVIQPSFFVLLVELAAIIQLGSILERLAGPFAFAATYVAAGTLASVAGLSSFPMRVSAGASGAVFGLYGLLLAVAAVCWWRKPGLTIPLAAITRLAPGCGAFLLCALVSDHGFGGFADLLGFVAGVAFGFVAVRDLEPDPARLTPSRDAWRPTAAALGASFLVVVAAAVPQRGIADVRPELRRLVDMEHRTAAEYQTASTLFAKGRMTARQLSELIEQSIVPEVLAEEARIIGLRGVPREDAPLVADAREYLQLRSESWQLRAKGLRDAGTPIDPSGADRPAKMTFRAWAEARHQSTLRTLGKAEGAERASLVALNRLPR